MNFEGIIYWLDKNLVIFPEFNKLKINMKFYASFRLFRMSLINFKYSSISSISSMLEIALLLKL